MKKVIPLFFIVVAALIVLRGFSPKKSDSLFPISEFGQLPVLEGGRYKPIDSLARTSLLLLRGKQSVPSPQGEKISATEWFMHLVLHPETAGTYEVLNVENLQLKELLGEKDMKRRYFSYNEVIGHAKTLDEMVKSIPTEAALQDAFQRDTLKLYSNLMLYRRLAFSFRVPLMQDSVEAEYSRFMHTLKAAAEKLHDNSEGDPDDEDLKLINRYARNFGSLSEQRSPKFVPVNSDEQSWFNLSEALMASFHTGAVPDVALLYAQLSDAYISSDVSRFSTVLDEIRQHYADFDASFSIGKVKSEAAVNQLQPFTLSMSLYIWTLIAVFVAWLVWDEKLLKTIFWILLVAFLIHSIGMLARMLIQGRPPVTNLYSSAVFVGWGAVALGLVLERIYRNGIGGSVACMVGFMSLIIANHLMASGDTMEMMRAVLDSNFWLATHVITISLGYSATYIAGFLALLYVFLGIFTNVLNPETEKSLVRMVYGIVCFSLLFSFIGTVLGGIWADQSWGRFWGWDPKENGALMIVIWNALILHAKRGGMVRNIGLMNLTIFGNVITSWSWFGTNMLGVGLHSYGFMSSAFFWLMTFCFSQVLFIILGGTVPKSKWRSFKAS